MSENCREEVKRVTCAELRAEPSCGRISLRPIEKRARFEGGRWGRNLQTFSALTMPHSSNILLKYGNHHNNQEQRV